MPMLETVKRSTRGDRPVIFFTRLGDAREDQSGCTAGHESNEPLAADELVGADTARQQRVTKPAVFQGDATAPLHQVLASVSAVKRRGNRHRGIDRDVVSGLGTEDDNSTDERGRGLDRVGNSIDRHLKLLAAGRHVGNLRDPDGVGPRPVRGTGSTTRTVWMIRTAPVIPEPMVT